MATKNESDKYFFRVAPLRNIVRTAPYFHDGSVARLEDAIRIMASVQLGRAMAETEVTNIAAFLDALTGPIPDHYAPPAPMP
jgi:cytochrome c peroxidase